MNVIITGCRKKAVLPKAWCCISFIISVAPFARSCVWVLGALKVTESRMPQEACRSLILIYSNLGITFIKVGMFDASNSVCAWTIGANTVSFDCSAGNFCTFLVPFMKIFLVLRCLFSAASPIFVERSAWKVIKGKVNRLTISEVVSNRVRTSWIKAYPLGNSSLKFASLAIETFDFTKIGFIRISNNFILPTFQDTGHIGISCVWSSPNVTLRKENYVRWNWCKKCFRHDGSPVGNECNILLKRRYLEPCCMIQLSV